MLISFLALIASVNAMLGIAHLSLQQIFGWVFAPVAWSMGVPWRDAPTVAICWARAWCSTSLSRTRCSGRSREDRPQIVHDLHVRAVRIRELQLDCIQIGGIGALAQSAATILARLGPARDVCGHWRIS